MKNKLVEIAKSIKVERRIRSFDKNEVGLALAWAKGEVQLFGVRKALGIKYNQSSLAYSFLARALAQHIKLNKK